MSAPRKKTPAVPNRIRAMRCLNGMTCEQLGKEIGRCWQTVQKWERLESCPSTYDACRLIRLFDVTFEELFDLETLFEDVA